MKRIGQEKPLLYTEREERLFPYPCAHNRLPHGAYRVDRSPFSTPWWNNFVVWNRPDGLVACCGVPTRIWNIPCDKQRPPSRNTVGCYNERIVFFLEDCSFKQVRVAKFQPALCQCVSVHNVALRLPVNSIKVRPGRARTFFIFLSYSKKKSVRMSSCHPQTHSCKVFCTCRHRKPRKK